ncbi:hypothetical protein ACJ5NV_14365 [Loktanella agnita]|uniref:hypothetical protein n=1 Tax=Loktanella agnita TaxID=287097 RepID=UPI003986A6DF
MKRLVLVCAMGLAGCETAGVGATGGGASTTREFMVIGNRMTFEQCRARGGLIIRDANTSMVACDPTVRGEPVPADEFNHPTQNVG